MQLVDPKYPMLSGITFQNINSSMTSIPSQVKNYPLAPVSNENELEENNSPKKQLNLVGTNKRVVDFGCGAGGFAQLLKQRGCRIVGVDLNAEAAKAAESHCDQVLVADLDFISILEILPDQTFDVAIFGDVLEHLRDPWRVLADARQILRPGGYVIASIPNIAHGAVRLSLLQGNFEYADVGLLDNTHLRFFTRKTVHELFEGAGYVIDVIDRITIPLFSDCPYVPHVDRGALSDELIHQVEQAEDADTLQFVVRAFPTSSEGKYAALELKYARAVEQNVKLQSELFTVQDELGQVRTTLQQAQTGLERLHTQLHQAQEGMTAMESSKFWKLRAVWVRCKKMLGFRV